MSSSIHPYTYKANLARVVDGDTFDFVLDLGFKIQKTVRVRLSGVDTNEIYGVKKESEEYQKGIDQKKYVEDVLNSANNIMIKTFEDDTGKYGRYIAEVIVDEENLANKIKKQFSYLQ